MVKGCLVRTFTAVLAWLAQRGMVGRPWQGTRLKLDFVRRTLGALAGLQQVPSRADWSCAGSEAKTPFTCCAPALHVLHRTDSQYAHECRALQRCRQDADEVHAAMLTGLPFLLAPLAHHSRSQAAVSSTSTLACSRDSSGPAPPRSVSTSPGSADPFTDSKVTSTPSSQTRNRSDPEGLKQHTLECSHISTKTFCMHPQP